MGFLSKDYRTINPIAYRLAWRTTGVYLCALPLIVYQFLGIFKVVPLPGWIRLDSIFIVAFIWIPAFIAQGYVIYHTHKLRRRLRETKGLLCPNCAYDL